MFLFAFQFLEHDPRMLVIASCSLQTLGNSMRVDEHAANQRIPVYFYVF